MLPIALYRVDGNSMAPYVSANGYVLINRFSYVFRDPKEGDVVVAKHPKTGRLIVKRISAIQADRYVLRGDNERESTDSRGFGPVTKKMLVGKVWRVLGGN